MPVMMPTAAAFSGGTPEAMATPIHKGRATRNTTTEARKSCLKDPKLPGVAPAGWVFSISVLSGKFPGNRRQPPLFPQMECIAVSLAGGGTGAGEIPVKGANCPCSGS